MDATGNIAAMTYTNLKIILGRALLLACSVLLVVRPAYAAPVALEDRIMDQVTAGNTNEAGGVVVGKSSNTTANSTTGINLNGEAQRKAKGLNLVNTTGSAVANTVNIWSGNVVSITVEDSDIKPVLEINQLNQVTQEQVQFATLSGYSRSGAEKTDIYKNSTDESYNSHIVNSNNATDFFYEEIASTTNSLGNVNTHAEFTLGDNKLHFEGHLGQGIAVAGSADINFDGGSADIALVIGGGVSVGADTANVKGDIKLPGFDLGTSSAQAGIDVEAGMSVLVEVELPKMNIQLSGAGCGVVMGSCNASSTVEEDKLIITDNSSQDIVENHQFGHNSFSDERINIYRSSFELENAKAEYIIVDDSSLEVILDVTLELSDSAQKEIEGMNIVNAINSNVANTTNVSRASEFKSQRSSLILNQFNTVHHGQ